MLRDKSLEELTKLHGDLVDELFRLKIKKAIKQLDKTHRFKLLRRDIARILTIKEQKTNDGVR